MGILRQQRLELESRLSMIKLGGWNEYAVKHFLSDSEMPDTTIPLASVMDATCGYQYLLHNLYATYAQNRETGLEKLAQELRETVDDHSSALSKTLHAAVGLNKNPLLETFFSDLVELVSPGEEADYGDVIELMTEEHHSKEQVESYMEVLDRTSHIVIYGDDKPRSFKVDPLIGRLLGR
jgi:hypothetical protein